MIFDSVLKTVRGIVKLRGGTDNSIIGNFGDELNVFSENNPRIQTKTYAIGKDFLNGANNSMDVNGATTAQNFVIAPIAGQIFYITGMFGYLDDSGNLERTTFGALATLTNGLQIIADVDGTEYEISNLRQNMQFTGFFSNFGIIPPSNKWFRSETFYFGSHDFFTPIVLVGDDGDQLIARVRDNLTGLDELYMQAKGYVII